MRVPPTFKSRRVKPSEGASWLGKGTWNDDGAFNVEINDVVWRAIMSFVLVRPISGFDL